MRNWWSGAVVGLVVLGGATPAIAQQPGVGNNRDLRVTPDAQNTDLTCPNPIVCFDVTSDQNITHIFVDLDYGVCRDAPFRVFVRENGALEEVTKLHTRGGPCNHGEDLIERLVWFPLGGNQTAVEVCIQTGNVPARVAVGAKASSTCRDAAVTATCDACRKPCPCSKCGPGSTPDNYEEY